LAVPGRFKLAAGAAAAALHTRCRARTERKSATAPISRIPWYHCSRPADRAYPAATSG